MRLEKFNENDEQLYKELVFNQEVMQMNYGRVFTAEGDQIIIYQKDIT